jgi:hypothetical protein
MMDIHRDVVPVHPSTLSMAGHIENIQQTLKGVTCEVINDEDIIPDDTPVKAEIVIDPLDLGAHRQHILDLLQRRSAMLRSTQQFVWFTFRKEADGGVYLSWPVAGYQHLPSRIIARDSRVVQASRRLSNRVHIKAVTVIGAIRTFDSYFPWIKAKYEV